MNEVLVRIDITSPTGRKIVRELEKHKKIVKLEYPLPEGATIGHSWEDMYKRGLDKLSAHYGVDMRKLKAEL